MKKLIISAICLLAFAAAGVSSYAYYRSHQIVAKNSLAKANVEALTDNELTTCPDYNYAPDKMIHSDCLTVTVYCNVDGEVTVNGTTFHGGFKKGKSYPIVIDVKNCVDANRACCDQRNVGVTIVG